MRDVAQKSFLPADETVEARGELIDRRPQTSDLVGAFFGLIPNVDFLVGSGLDIERGILVDEYLRTNLPDVWAAGDCAQVYNPAIRNYWVSIGWPNAQRLGEAAARNMLGARARAEEPPANVLTYEGIKVQTAWWREF